MNDSGKDRIREKIKDIKEKHKDLLKHPELTEGLDEEPKGQIAGSTESLNKWEDDLNEES